MFDFNAFYSLSSPADKRRFAVALLSAGAVAVLEALSLVAIVALLSLVTGASSALPLDPVIASFMGSDLLGTSIVVLGLVVAKNSYALFNEWYQNRFVSRYRHRLSVALLTAILARPYAFFLGENTDTLSARFLSDVDRVSEGYLRAMLVMLTEIAVLSALLGVLFLKQAEATLLLVVGVVTLGALFLTSLKRVSKQVSYDLTKYQHKRYVIGGSAMAGIKDIKAACVEKAFVARFAAASRSFSQVQVTQGMLIVSPRLVIETVGFASLVIAIWIIQRRTDNIAAHLPVIGMYATAAYRMLPSVNRVFSSLQQLRLAEEPMLAIASLMGAPFRIPENEADDGVLVKHDFGVANLQFRYPGASRDSLDDVSFTVKANEFVGVVGPSGAGKSTLVDVLLGLLEPSSGSLVVDGSPIENHMERPWRRGIGYVPQTIFLIDGSIRENIVFGRAGVVHDGAVTAAATLARLDDFVDTLPCGYDTEIGENGVRLSGGQRQRIGIARALYGGARILLFDEATSSLDYETERLVSESIQNLAGSLSIIVVAHRLSTVANADRLLVLDHGRLVAEGTYRRLTQESPLFAQMLRAANL